MRISDWSSDVCSSDLGDERCQHAAGVRHVRNRSPHLRFDQRICGLAMPATDEGEAARLRLFRRWAGKGEEEQGEHARERSYQQDELHIRHLFILWPERHSRSRSEEHTSELQSLMRISYAVFCLTKKHQNERNTQVI